MHYMLEKMLLIEMGTKCIVIFAHDQGQHTDTERTLKKIRSISSTFGKSTEGSGSIEDKVPI